MGFICVEEQYLVVSQPQVVPILIEETGLTPAEAVDYWAVWWDGRYATSWGEKRGVSQQAVSSNVNRAMDEIRYDLNALRLIVERLMSATLERLEADRDISIVDELRIEKHDGAQFVDLYGIDIQTLFESFDPETSLADGPQAELRAYWHDIVGSEKPIVTIRNRPSTSEYVVSVNGFLRIVED